MARGGSDGYRECKVQRRRLVVWGEVDGQWHQHQGSTNEVTKRQVAEYVQVKDKDIIKWSTDESVQRPVKKKIPAVHKAACAEIGDDIWSMYFTLDDSRNVVTVECDMIKCNKAKVAHVKNEKYSFLRTTNICDAGWQAAKSSKFGADQLLGGNFRGVVVDQLLRGDFRGVVVYFSNSSLQPSMPQSVTPLGHCDAGHN